MKLKLRFILFLSLCYLIFSAFIPYTLHRQLYCSVQYTASVYRESADELGGPYRGVFRLHGYYLSESAPITPAIIEEHISKADGTRLSLILINLRNYRRGAISDAGLKQIQLILDTWSKNNFQLILRFVYDWEGAGKRSEPDDINIIYEHMHQVSSLVNQYKDHIHILQGCFLGSYGEMHSSNYLTDDNMIALFEYLASITDPSIFLAVRRPSQWRTVTKSDVPLSEEEAFNGTLASRLSLYNDGMLGSHSDLGTYRSLSREEEIAFQDLLCRFVPNGGEVVIDNPYNDLSNAIQDMSLMHVSYISSMHHPAVLRKWRNTLYEGNDVFHGFNGYDYIRNHLGYRYVLRDSELAFHTLRDITANFSIAMENVGFSNSYRHFPATLTLRHRITFEEITIPLDSDNRFWNSGETSTLSIPLDVRRLDMGSYHVFFNLTDPLTEEQILLANDQTLTKWGYKLGTLSIRSFHD